MHIAKKTGYVILAKKSAAPSRITHESHNWKIWRATVTITTCYYCASMNGRILAADAPELEQIPVHPNRKCFAEWVAAIFAGTATSQGANGVDLYVALHGGLPAYYITSEEALNHDWVKSDGNLADVLPGRMIGGDVFENRKHKLPEAPGRIWFEADFDYTGGYRNSFRLLYSNDGLIFVTYDHYATFYEIDTEGIL